MERDQRGSDFIKERFADRPEITEEDLLWIGEMADEGEVDLLSFWVYGQPLPDVAGGTLRVSTDSIGSVVERFVEQRDPAYELSVYPAGQPNAAVVKFKTPIDPDAWIRGQPSLGAIDGKSLAQE